MPECVTQDLGADVNTEKMPEIRKVERAGPEKPVRV